MQTTESEYQARAAELAQKYGFSPLAGMAAAESLRNSGGGMAQFNHPEFGGMGQWMRGGMTMIGDMFNSNLQSRVTALFNELANVPLPAPGAPSFFMASPSASGNWWPTELGIPSTSGGQNDTAYAYFPQHRRLVIRAGGHTSTYDTTGHHIGGFSQQQGSGAGSLQFSSQQGQFYVTSLPLV